MNIEIAHDGEHQSWKTRAATKIDKHAVLAGQKGKNLGGVMEMALPEVRQGPRPDQIDRLLPVPEQACIGIEPRECFT